MFPHRARTRYAVLPILLERTMATELQVGLIGYGLAGSVFHAPLILHTPGLALHSIVSSQRDRLLRSFTDVRLCEDPQQLFDDPAVDAVVIATPNDAHAPLARAALAAGKHVLVDKPFALSVAEAESVVQAAQDAERVVTVFQNRRHDADFLTLKRVIDEGGSAASPNAIPTSTVSARRCAIAGAKAMRPAAACGWISVLICWIRCCSCSAGPARSAWT